MNNLYVYTNSTIRNLVVFFKNIKKIKYNKKKIKNMLYDSNNYYSGSDFLGYIEYLRRTNSIKNGLKNLFRKTDLYSKQLDYLTEHEKCVYWIQEYCNKEILWLNIMYINYRTK